MRRSATLTMMIMLYFATILGTPLRAQDAATTESLVIAFIETLSPEEQATAQQHVREMTRALNRVYRVTPGSAEEVTRLVLSIQGGLEWKRWQDEFRAVSDTALLDTFWLLEDFLTYRASPERIRRFNLHSLAWIYRERQLKNPDGPHAGALLSVAYYFFFVDARYGYCQSAGQALIYAQELERYDPATLKLPPSEESQAFLLALVGQCQSGEGVVETETGPMIPQELFAVTESP